MATIKNTGNQPRGFYNTDGTMITVQPGETVEISMTEADYDKCVEVAESVEPPPYEISGGAGGPKKLSAKEQAAADAKKADEDAKKAAEEAKAKAEEEEEAAASRGSKKRG